MRKYLRIQIILLTIAIQPGFISTKCSGQSNGKSHIQAQLQNQKPIHSYIINASLKKDQRVKLDGPARLITVDGRTGLNITSIRTVLEMKAHTMKEKRGSVTMWVLSLEELATSFSYSGMAKSNPHWRYYPLLSDNPNPQNFDGASFKWVWYNGWHPNFIAMFGKERLYENAFNMPHKALISVSHFNIKPHTWYQYALTWDYEKDQYRMYVNGIEVGREDQYKTHRPHRDSINSSLYIGNPTFCYSDVNFYNHVLLPTEIQDRFKQTTTKFDQQLNDELLTTYAGKNPKPFSFNPDGSWKNQLNLSFKKTTHLDSFYVQGNPVDVKITNEGLLIETIEKEMTANLLDSQMYLWTRKPFEGDLYVEYEYQSLRYGGLSLLLTQASGMNREDFMADYPLRKSGRMTMIYGEDVRSYHWEYYREQADMRNDLDNSAFMKQPFNQALAFSSRNIPLSKNTWHKIQFLQTGKRIRGAIDGVLMFDVMDSGHNNNGPVYDFGRIAIRCMLRTKMLFRNLKVYNKIHYESEAF
ncbi:DUF1961 family protein [Flavitalea antarctica]